MPREAPGRAPRGRSPCRYAPSSARPRPCHASVRVPRRGRAPRWPARRPQDRRRDGRTTARRGRIGGTTTTPPPPSGTAAAPSVRSGTRRRTPCRPRAPARGSRPGLERLPLRQPEQEARDVVEVDATLGELGLVQPDLGRAELLRSAATSSPSSNRSLSISSSSSMSIWNAPETAGSRLRAVVGGERQHPLPAPTVSVEEVDQICRCSSWTRTASDISIAVRAERVTDHVDRLVVQEQQVGDVVGAEPLLAGSPPRTAASGTACVPACRTRCRAARSSSRATGRRERRPCASSSSLNRSMPAAARSRRRGARRTAPCRW